MGLLADITRLVRLKVSLMVAVATAFGYALAAPVWDASLLLVCAGTFGLACACSVGNQVQERRVDALFRRTCDRPVASGRMSVWLAVAVAAVLAAGSGGLLYAAGGAQLVWLGVGIVAVYNGLYTPLKARSAFALLVGSVPGATPPVMGWVAAGGELANPVIGLVFIVYYLWQVPHFWLRAQRDREEYVLAGVPVLPAVVDGERYGRLLTLWYYGYVVGIMMLPVFPLMHSVTMRAGITLLGCVMLVCMGMLRTQAVRAFALVNISLVLVMGCLLYDRLSVAWMM